MGIGIRSLLSDAMELRLLSGDAAGGSVRWFVLSNGDRNG